MTTMDALLNRAAARNLPAAGTMELTARCNLSCKMCYIHNLSCDKHLVKEELSTEQWICIMDQLQDAGTLPLLITGGEPLLRPDFPILYTEAVKRGFLISINTNGTLLTEEHFELFARQKPLRMNISVYGMCPETYESLCGNGAAYEKVLSNIRRLRSLGITVKINFSCTPYNAHDLPKVQAFAQEIGSIVHCTTYMFPPTRTEKPCAEPVERYSPTEAAEASIDWIRIANSPEQFAAECRKHAQMAPGRADECLYEGKEGARCRAGRCSYWITYKGELLPCGMIPSISHSVTELGFSEAWNRMSAEFRSLSMPKGCLSCPDYERCEVCPAITWAENEDFSKVPTYICEKNRHYHSRLAALGAEGSEA
ncbi:MAG: radical SAM protein [Oscillospiraceae bacterium]|nr:radical SAM protein [Oscillospiraceae bacterium]